MLKSTRLFPILALLCWTSAIHSQSSRHALLEGIERLAAADYPSALSLLERAAAEEPKSAVAEAWLAHAFHLQRRLDEASVHYTRALELDPVAAQPDSTKRAAMLRFAPRVYQVASDPFGLRDVVAIHHPQEPLIAYHLFWEDDIDFPEDNDPCDHEVVWVRYSAQTDSVAELVTYFHGRMLSSPASLLDAAANGGRVRVNVQWGKHGSLPSGWEALKIQADAGDVEKAFLTLDRETSLSDYNRATFQKLHTEGRRLPDHPLA